MLYNKNVRRDFIYTQLKKELNKYYRKLDKTGFLQFRDEETTFKFRERFYRIFDEMDAFYKDNQKMPAVLLKSKIHT